MNYLNKGNEAEFDLMIRFLSKRFKIKRPKLKVSNRTNANHGWQSDNTIHLSKHSQLWVLVHEFAHYLDAVKYRRVGYGYADREWHNECFYWHLRAVIKNIEPVGYPWYKEYKQLQRWAIRDKLLWIYEE